MIVQILPYIQIILSLLLIGGVLLQRSEAGLGSAFGGGDGTTGGRFMRRGFEKLLFNVTIVVATLFALSAFASLLLSR
jgi:protein translocase SecG subunit